MNDDGHEGELLVDQAPCIKCTCIKEYIAYMERTVSTTVAAAGASPACERSNKKKALCRIRPSNKLIKCIVFGFFVALFIFIIVLLSLMLYAEQKNSNEILNELRSSNEQLDCYKRKAGHSMCPRKVSGLSKCRRVTTIDCEAFFSG